MDLKERTNYRMNVFLIANMELGNPLPPPGLLTDLLRHFVIPKDISLNLIVSKSEIIPPEIKRKTTNICQIDTSLYSIKDNLKFSLEAYRILKKQNKEKKIDIIHCLRPNSSLLAAVLFKLFNNPKVKIVYDVRSNWIEMSVARGHIRKYLIPFYKVILYTEEFFLTRFVDKFIFITEALKKFYRKKLFIDLKKSIVLGNGVNLNLFGFKNNTRDNIRKRYFIKNQDIVLGYIGTLTEIRSLDFLIRVLGKLPDKKYKLMFIGDGEAKEKLAQLAKGLKVEDNVIFTGKVKHEEIPNYISSLDIGLCHLPDILVFRQSFPIKILEYLACGIPVLASDIETHQEMAKNLQNIYLYKLNEKDFINKLKNVNLTKLYQDNRKQLENYSWSSLSQKTVSIYNNLC